MAAHAPTLQRVSGHSGWQQLEQTPRSRRRAISAVGRRHAAQGRSGVGGNKPQRVGPCRAPARPSGPPATRRAKAVRALVSVWSQLPNSPSPSTALPQPRRPGSMWLRIAGLTGASAVAGGAYGAHGFHPSDPYYTEVGEEPGAVGHRECQVPRSALLHARLPPPAPPGAAGMRPAAKGSRLSTKTHTHTQTDTQTARGTDPPDFLGLRARQQVPPASRPAHRTGAASQACDLSVTSLARLLRQ